MADIRGVLCFDLGATRLKAGFVADGEVDGFVTRPTAGADAAAAIAAVVDAARELRDRYDPQRVGVGIPGVIEDGRVTALPGKFEGIVGTDVESELSRELALPVMAVNDAVAYGAGEAAYGSGRGSDRAVVVTIGTGVGVTVLEHGHAVAGGPLGAGILGGQIPIADDDAGPTDTNGRRGTIEARCSATAIVHYAREAGFDEDADIPGIYTASRDGDRAAHGAIVEYRGWLARALVALAHAHTPGVIVLGGGPMPEGNPVVDGLERMVREHLWPGYSTRITVASLGDRSSLLGLAHLLTREETGGE